MLRAFSVTSSAFYWPFPFADGAPADYVHDSKGEGQEDSFDIAGGLKMDYVASHFTQEDNFCRVDIERKEGAARMVVRMYDAEGGLIHNVRGDGSRYPLKAALELAPW